MDCTVPQTIEVDSGLMEEAKPVQKNVLEALGGGEDVLFGDDEEVSMGRLSSNTVVMHDNPYVSSNHLKLWKLGNDVFVLDLSRNGTWVGEPGNLKRIGAQNRKKLCHGEVISLLDQSIPTNKGKLMYKLRLPSVEHANDEKWGAIAKEYIIGRKLGTGNFATVYLGTHKQNGKEVAVKIIDKKKTSLGHNFSVARLLEEVRLLKSVSHEGVVKIHDVYDDEKYLCIVLELVRGGDLFDYIVNSKRFTEPEARRMFKQIIEALLYLHSKEVAHRDLKPENVLLGTEETFEIPPAVPGQDGYAKQQIPVDSLVLKLSDFGLAKWTGDRSVMLTYCGTPVYIAPEVQKKNGYTISVDMWSTGVILYLLLTGSLPKDPHSGTQFPDRHWAGISSAAKDLTSRLLTIDPATRIDLAGVCAHPWMDGEVIKGRELAAVTSKKRKHDEDESDAQAVKKMKSASRVRWMWKSSLDGDDEKAESWTEYPAAECKKIEIGFRKYKEGLQKTVKVNANYKIDLNNMFQWNIAEPDKQRSVKRITEGEEGG
eukprot:TRINITY_DN9027_c0_g1_i1.p1 TRINITY_DN9027_c0_g1~~TRINITY_DN9027_c0_g1_i1.p1  ORF type:complete len:567 (+),score=143.74 TRINITY_DN9027_c0_g1_i1:83-1702(+)